MLVFFDEFQYKRVCLKYKSEPNTYTIKESYYAGPSQVVRRRTTPRRASVTYLVSVK